MSRFLYRLASAAALFGAVLFPGEIRAAPGLEAFVAEVLERQPRIRARVWRREAVSREASAAGLWPDPSLSVMLDRVPEHEGGEMPMVQYQLSQMVPWPGKLGLMERAELRRADAAGAEVDVERLRLSLDAKRAYLMLLLNTRRRAVNVANQDLVGAIARAVLGRYAAGTGGHHEVTRAQVEESALRIEGLDLEGERVSMVAMLNALRDRPTDTPIADPQAERSEPPAGAPAALTKRALEQRPEIAVMRAMQREALTMGELARRERYPDLMTAVWYNQMIGGPDSGGVMVGVTLPIFGATRQTRRALAKDAYASAADAEVAAMAAMIRFEVADAYQKLETAERSIDLLETVAMPRVRQSFESSLAAYATGVGDIVGLLDARRSLQAMELALLRADVDRRLAIAELERAVGVAPSASAR